MTEDDKELIWPAILITIMIVGTIVCASIASADIKTQKRAGTTWKLANGQQVVIIKYDGNNRYICRVDNGPESTVRYSEITFLKDELLDP